jgi:predicted kinase
MTTTINDLKRLVTEQFTVLVLRGLPGSGKSTLIKQFPWAVVVSADTFMVDDAGAYSFDPARLPLCHGRCLREFTEALVNGRRSLIIVDNTNTTTVECAPYMALAPAFGYKALLVTLNVLPSTSAARNVHGVGAATIEAMRNRMESAVFPPYWDTLTFEDAT